MDAIEWMDWEYGSEDPAEWYERAAT